jgi:hypothetical protein
MEFKGTKGKWWACCIQKKPHFVFAGESEIVICKPYQTQDFYSDLSDEEFRANALLISKSPEMLEMLKSVLELQKENYGNATHTHLSMINKAKEIEQLIKSATEIGGKNE